MEAARAYDGFKSGNFITHLQIIMHKIHLLTN